MREKFKNSASVTNNEKKCIENTTENYVFGGLDLCWNVIIHSVLWK
jgi:hypothetical protein